MQDFNFIAGNKNLDFNTAVEAVIRRSCIIDFGIVQSVPANGIVNVAVAVANTKQNMACMTCVLVNIASSSFAVNVKPNVGDRVLVIYPRLYDENMFTVPDSDTDKKKVIVNENASGYNMLSGLAILINQYKTNSHKNVLKVENGLVSFTNVEKNQSVTVDLTQNNKIVISDSNSCTIESTSEGIVINGNLKVKK